MSHETDMPTLDASPTWKLALKASLASTAFITTAMVRIGDFYADDPMMVPSVLIDSHVYYGAGALPRDTIELVNTIANQPTGPAYEAYERARPDKLPLAYLSGDGLLEYGEVIPETSVMSDSYYAFASQQAANYGLRLENPASFIERVNTAKSSKTVIAALQEYCRLLGFELVIHENLNLQDLGAGVNALESDIVFNTELTEGVVRLLHVMSYVPKEVFEFADLNEIRVVESVDGHTTNTTGEFIPDAVTVSSTRTIYLPRDYLYSGVFNVFAHELGHIIDYRMNGNSVIGMQRDSEYAALNEPGHTYGLKDDYIGNVARSYGGASIREDKATMLESMLNGINTGLLYSDHQTVREKYRLELGRMERYVPGFAPYMLSIIPHQ